jgi:hypothetical protein
MLQGKFKDCSCAIRALKSSFPVTFTRIYKQVFQKVARKKYVYSWECIFESQ